MLATRPARSPGGRLGGADRRVDQVGSSPMLAMAVDQATGQTLALLVTFLGVGLLVNVMIIYIILQVLAERRQNREANERQLAP
jgi:hypothetical protein